MRFFQGKNNGSFASLGLGAMLVGVVLCASCGSKSNGLGDDGSGGSGDGADASCTSFGGCGDPSQDGSFAGTGSGDSGVGIIDPVDGSVVANDCPGTISASSATALEKATSNAAGIKMLYPYEGTVYPGGIAGPVLQWSQSGTPESVYVHLTSKNFDYQGCFKGSNPPQLTIPPKAWATAFAQSGGKNDPLTIAVGSFTGGTASGLVKTKLIFAKGSLAGNVYYNTYGSHLTAAQNGAVMKIEKGVAAPLVYTTGLAPVGPCVSCHSLSADGTVLAAQQHAYPGGLNGKGSMTFNLKTTPKPDPTMPMANSMTDDWGFSAVYPDGSFLMTCGESADSTKNFAFPGVPLNNPGMIGPKVNSLYDTKTGTTIPFTGLTGKYAMMPSFSPDGKHIVYNDFDAGQGHQLTVMDFDKGSKTFSNAKSVFKGSSTQFVGWPFFTPDSKWVVFAVGTGDNYATTQNPPASLPINNSEIYFVSASGGAAHRLDQLEGYSGSTLYLPGGSTDATLDFYPTVNPISTGGYNWVYFTSRRAYGNINTAGTADPASKIIWVSAIDSNAAPGTDPSHPAFVLPGQELKSGNIRAFAVLAPCVGDGAGCEGGYDCCGGSCTAGKCAPPSPLCAAENNRCSKDGDCCNTSLSCISGFCSSPAPR